MELIDNSLINYINKKVKEYNIDESHGLNHALNTYKWAKKISVDFTLSDLENKMIMYCSMLHDMCDHKYCDSDKELIEIEKFLKLCCWTDEHINILINIITTMSYSKYIHSRYWPCHNEWQNVYHIVRQADLIDSYSMKRCYLYTTIKLGYNDNDAKDRIITLINNRVLKYITDELLISEKAKEISYILHANLVIELDKYSTDNIIYDNEYKDLYLLL